MKRSAGPLPEGFVYRPDFLTEAGERALLDEIALLEFGEVRMHGVVARRRIAHFGWLYRFDSREVAPGPAIPPFLEPVRARLAALASVPPEELGEALVTEYPPGAGIGWHRDAPPFGIVAAVSLAGPCRFRFQHGTGDERQRSELILEPRSAYVLAGPARTRWQHHIPPTKALRYSVTFRTLRRRPA